MGKAEGRNAGFVKRKPSWVTVQEQRWTTSQRLELSWKEC